jgi:hypothetical protein
MISFLHPWFWLGALAIAAPIWLHLRRRTETDLVRFSALRFLEDSPQPRQSSARLSHLFLFSLRTLGLLLVVGAFAWPFWRGAPPPPVKESRVYVLDNTLSHQADDGFKRDVERILREVGRAGRELQVGVIELTAQPRVVAAFGEDAEAATRKLRALQPSFQRGSYLAAFRQANAMLAHALGARKRIVFCSDNQENQWAENLNTPPFLYGVEVELPNAQPAERPNLSLAEPRAQRIFLGDKSLVNFTVKLSHQGPATAAIVGLQVNGQAIFNRPVDLAGQPETILLQAQWEAEPALWLGGEATVEGAPDALPGDNRVLFSLPPVREGKVALLAQSSYLRVALSPEVMRGHWATRVLEPGQLAAEAAGSDETEVLCLEAAYLQSPDARKLVWRYLTNGRGVILLVNRVGPVVSGALRELGFELFSVPASTKPRAEKFQYVISNHPIFHPFLSPEYGNLMEVEVFNPARLKVNQGIPLVFSESGEGLLFLGTQFPGRLFVVAFGFEREQTTWPLHVTFIPFLDLCLQNARPEDTTPGTYEPGEWSVIRLPADTPVREVVLRAGQREVARAAVSQGQAQLPMPGQPGLYALSYDASTEPAKLFSVNPSPKESRLTYVAAPEALKVWQLSNPQARPAAPAASATLPATLSRAAILEQQHWWWCLLGSLGALLVESAWTAHKLARA